tara:strand:- start:449 stop:631 length:183 start_codon:yes stop_codon:yes gene_type:complete
MINTVEKYYIDSENTQWGETYKVIFTDSSIAYVPHDTENRHYQEILEWVANGGTIVDNGA